MRYSDYYACPYCGASLDPGERCDCQDRKEQEVTIEVKSKGDKDDDKSHPYRSFRHPNRYKGQSMRVTA